MLSWCRKLQSRHLRIPDSYHAKIMKIHTPLVRFALYFHNQAGFQKFEHSFFDQVAIDIKSVLTFENCPLVAENTFNMYGHLVKIAMFRFLKDGPVVK